MNANNAYIKKYSGYKLLILSCIASVSLGFVGSAQAAVLPVICTDTAPVDGQNIQAAINSAVAGDTVLIKGPVKCKMAIPFAGTSVPRIFINTSDITITGERGATGPGSWDTVIHGSTAGSRVGNVFSFGPTDGVIKNVTIKDIKFEDLGIIIRVDAQFGSVSGNFTGLCTDIVGRTGTTSGVVIKNNWFNNVNRGVQNVGNSENLLIADNLMTLHPSSNRGILVQGVGPGCGGVPGVVHFAAPAAASGMTIVNNTILSGISGISFLFNAKHLTIKNNVISDQSNNGMSLNYITHSLIRDNIVTHAPQQANNFLDGIAGIVIDLSSHTQVLHNTVDGWTYGIALDGIPVTGFGVFQPESSENVLVANNEIKNSTGTGVGAVRQASGFRVVNNTFEGNPIDVYLTGLGLGGLLPFDNDGSHDNRVISGKCIKVLDLGVNNIILGKAGSNSCKE